jgi:glycosyltransferase involved in cell wall biosynthesis
MKDLLILPAYNEEDTLEQTVKELQDLPNTFEVVIINDGSRDRTGEIAERLAQTSRVPLQVVHLPFNGGIGVSVQTGYLFALARGGYRYVFQFDADGQHDAAYILPMIDECERGRLDLCIGSRFLDRKPGDFQSTWIRRQGIRFLAWLIRTLSGVYVTDPTSGLRCAGPRAWASFARNYPEDYPEPESLYWCARNKLRIGEIPVRMRARRGGVSSINYMQTLFYLFKVSLAIVIDSLRKKEPPRS